MAEQTPSYPVYLSPDGTREQIAATPTREVELQFAGWTLVTKPRKRTDGSKTPTTTK